MSVSRNTIQLDILLMVHTSFPDSNEFDIVNCHVFVFDQASVCGDIS